MTLHPRKSPVVCSLLGAWLFLLLASPWRIWQLSPWEFYAPLWSVIDYANTFHLQGQVPPDRLIPLYARNLRLAGALLLAGCVCGWLAHWLLWGRWERQRRDDRERTDVPGERGGVSPP